jgi:ammonium transporter, Amt family
MVRLQRGQRDARGFGDGTAFLNTDIAASFAAISWLIVAWIRERKPKFLGLLTGAVAGLATITPAAGYVSPTTAVIIGAVSGVVCYFAVEMKNKLHWDDALDVWGVHGVGGFLGILMLGLFANSAFNPAGTNGLLYGNPASSSNSWSRCCSRRCGRSASPTAC